MNALKRLFILVKMGIIMMMLSPFFVSGQLLDPVSFSIDLSSLPDTARAGDLIEVSVQADMEDDWHLYSIYNHPDAGPIPTRFSSSGEMILAGDITESQADRAYDPNFDTELGWHSRFARFMIPVMFDPSLSGTRQISIDVHYQTCDDRSCLPPVIKTLSASIQLAGSTTLPDGVHVTGGDFGVGTGTAQSVISTESVIPSRPYLLLFMISCLLLACAFYIRARRLNVKN